MKLSVVILAAGEGKRMHSQQPKVLQLVAGRPLLSHILSTANNLEAAQICVVHGYKGQLLKEIYKDQKNITWVEQKERLGTGHAALQAVEHIPQDHYVLIVAGDVPLTRANTLGRLINTTLAHDAGLGLLTAEMDDPTGLGRIVRDMQGNILEIVEEKDASIAQKAINEIFTGIMVVRADLLHEWLPNLSNENAQAEYYLTELPQIAVRSKVKIASGDIEDKTEILGANTRQQLAKIERAYQARLADELMNQGVTLSDPSRIDIRGCVKAGVDVVIDINAVFEGNVEIGNDVVIEPNCVIRNTKIANNVRIKANSVIDGAVIGSEVEIGPFARIRPGSVLENGSKVGNFVEMKKSTLGKGSKVNHLSYVGDALIGKGVNIGAGTITCNYDGVNKHQTIIEDAVFIGSDTQLVAPVKIGFGVTVGAGSTITKDVPAGGLVLSRVEQTHFPKWKGPLQKVTLKKVTEQ